MLSIEQALRMVVDAVRPLPATRRPLVECLGLSLAEDIVSDIDSPPHDKSIVDGYAVRSADLAPDSSCRVAQGVALRVVEEVTAGRVPSRVVGPGETTRLMTGAPLPDGCDAVVMVERSRVGDSPDQVLLDDTPAPEQHVMRRGVSLRRGERVLAAGVRLRPIEIGLLAEFGAPEPLVVPAPRVGVLPTGDELVSPAERPGPGQIRNSNGPMLAAIVRRSGGIAEDLGVARDTAEDLSRAIRRGLECDLLLLSGGVSAGVLDLAPAALRDCGVRERFHKVDIKPGKPVWFGVLDGPRPVPVFGLPGNPVSSLVGFELFVRPALAILAGRAGIVEATWGELAIPFIHRGDRPTCHPARVTAVATGANDIGGAVDVAATSGATGPIVARPTGATRVTPLPWRGSADLRALADANALALFPGGQCEYEPGAPIRWLPLDRGPLDL